jgi:hypothetical protein
VRFQTSVTLNSSRYLIYILSSVDNLNVVSIMLPASARGLLLSNLTNSLRVVRRERSRVRPVFPISSASEFCLERSQCTRVSCCCVLIRISQYQCRFTSASALVQRMWRQLNTGIHKSFCLVIAPAFTGLSKLLDTITNFSLIPSNALLTHELHCDDLLPY